MFRKLTDHLRRRYHPLWRIRRTRIFRFIQRHCDLVVYKGSDLKVALRLLRNFNFFVPHTGDEDESVSMFTQVLKAFRVRTLFDLGANVGVYAWCALRARPDIRLFLFEPDPVNIDLLRRTIKRNNLKEVEIFEGVVADGAGKLEFRLDDASGAIGSIMRDGAPGSFHDLYESGGHMEVLSTTLDSYLSRELMTPVFVKIDVEGAEGLVLKGARDFTRKFRPWYLIECFELEKLSPLADLDYGIFSLGAGNWLLYPAELGTSLVERALLSEAVKPLKSFLSERIRSAAAPTAAAH